MNMSHSHHNMELTTVKPSMPLVLVTRNQPSTSYATGAKPAYDSQAIKTLLSLDDVSLRNIFSYLSLPDFLAFAHTCTRLQGIARLLMPDRFSHITARLVIDHKNVFKNMDFRNKIKCFSGFAKIELDFDKKTGAENLWQFSKRMFTILYFFCSRPIDKFTIRNLHLTETMPIQMRDFFIRVPVGELTLLNCSFTGETFFHNIESLRVKPKRHREAWLMNYDTPCVESLSLFSKNHRGLANYMVNHPQLSHLEVHKQTSAREFRLISEQPNIRSLFWLGKFRFANRTFSANHFPALEKLGLKFTNDQNYLRNITQLFGQLDTIKCVSLFVDWPNESVPDFSMFDLLSRIRNIQRLEVRYIDRIWEYKFTKDQFIQWVENTPTLEEIDLTFSGSNFYKFFSKDVFDRFYQFCETNGRCLKFTINVCLWEYDTQAKVIQSGITEDYLDSVANYLDIYINFLERKKRLHVQSSPSLFHPWGYGY